jgi:hypothetical protein
MNCPKCGVLNEDTNKFCKNCGAALIYVAAGPPVPPAPPAPEVQPVLPNSPADEVKRSSGFAVASLVLGIIGLIINPLSILAIIFGGLSLSEIRKNPSLGGKGMATAGLVLGIIVAAIWVLVIFVIVIFATTRRF